ncbi:MAG: DUF4105 domain-containing protein [Chitinivibrionales bacterium]|nr:DUF4105 domain-containing protein [Chitinivibrionales bacterium]
MRKILTIAAVTLVCLLLVAAGILYYLIHYTAPQQNELISMSTPPEGDSTASPRFALCDSVPCSCACDDPYDPRTLVDSGVYKGFCLNTCQLRSGKIIGLDEVRTHGYFQPQADTSLLYVANIFDKDTVTNTTAFYVGRIDCRKVSDVIIQIEHAGGVQGHSQFMFCFSDPTAVALVPQRTDRPHDTLFTDRLCFSAEAIAPPSIPYKGDYGFRRTYLQTYRVTTLPVRAVRMIKELHRPVWQYRVNGTPQQLRQTVLEALHHATAADPKDRYHTTQNNCVLALFRILDRSMPPAWFRRPLLWITDNTLFMPTRAPNHMRYRGLASREPGRFHLPNLEAQLGWQTSIPVMTKQ